MPNSVVRGVATLFDAFFYEEDNSTPQFAVGGVTYIVTAFNGMVIDSGVAEQDVINLARWKVNLTIPLSAPITTGNDYYTLVWRAKTTTGNINRQRDTFTVLSAADDDLSDDGSTVALAGQPFQLDLAVPNNPMSTAFSLRILRAGTNTPLITLTGLNPGNSSPTVTGPIQDGSTYHYITDVSGNLLDTIAASPSSGGFAPFFAYYNFKDSNNRDQTVVNPIYLVNGVVITIMNAMDKYCNLLKNMDVVQQLQITDSKLAHFAVQGLLKVNATSPGNYGFDFNTLGLNGTFLYWTIKCAQLELLEALYLAEGMSAFDFSGMTVQLNSDRTQYISTMISELRSDIDSQLPRVKSQYARGGAGTGRMGTVGINYGPNTLFSYPISGGLFPGGAGMFPGLPFII